MANRINLGAVIGATGATGAQGLTGASGQDGITPHIENGYWYIGSTNQNVKAKGDTWYKGTGAPTDQGVNGDYYIDTATNDVYYKQNNVWGFATNIRGAQGEQGEQGENATSISIGTVTSLPNGEPATAELVALGNGVYQLNLGIPEGAQGEQGQQGLAGNTTAYVGGFAVNTLNFDSDPQAQIDSKLGNNLGSENAGKILSVDASGNIIATTSTAEDDVIDAYIVGSTDFAYDWLSLSAGGEPLTATQGKIYVVRSTGDYYLLQFVWNGTTYEQTGGGDTSGLALKTEAVGSIVLSIDNSTYVITLQAKDVNGANIGTAQTIDLPLESVVVNGSYNTSTQKLILTLQNGNTIEIDISDIISGLQNEITASNKLSADLVDDTSTTNKFTNATEKATWNGKQDNLGITAQDIQSAVTQIGLNTQAITQLSESKQDVMQYDVMPEPPSDDEVGKIVQYVGADMSATVQTGTFLNGHFYKAVASGNTYVWEEIEFGGSAPENMVTTDTTQTITGEKTFTEYLKIGSASNPTIKTLSTKPLGATGRGGSVDCIYTQYGYGTTFTWSGMQSHTSFDQGSAIGWTPDDGIATFGLIRSNPLNQKVMVVNFSYTQTALTGDGIITKVNANKLLNNQVITCIADSTDTDVTYKEKHTYKFNYANNTWTATDITPSSAPTMFTNVSASTWEADSTYTDYGYKCVLSVSGVTANDLAEVVFGVAEATSGNYAPVVETGAGTITIYSKVDDTITIPTIKVEKL